MEGQLNEKEAEIERLREKTSDKAQESVKEELRRAYDVLKHLKKKVGAHAFNEEYAIVMNEIREALEMPPMQTAKTRKMKKPKKVVKEMDDEQPELELADQEARQQSLQDGNVLATPEKSQAAKEKPEEDNYQLPLGTDDEAVGEKDDYKLPTESGDEGAKQGEVEVKATDSDKKQSPVKQIVQDAKAECSPKATTPQNEPDEQQYSPDKDQESQGSKGRKDKGDED